jgi:hypothetical protein
MHEVIADASVRPSPPRLGAMDRLERGCSMLNRCRNHLRQHRHAVFRAS